MTRKWPLPAAGVLVLCTAIAMGLHARRASEGAPEITVPENIAEAPSQADAEAEREPEASGGDEELPDPPGEGPEEQIEANVEPYRVSAGLEEVVNLKHFTKQIPLTAEQRRLLAKNLFVCTPSDAEQLFFVYESNDYQNIPSFVTTDVVLQLWHTTYDFVLRRMETDALRPALIGLTRDMLKDSQALYGEVTDPKLKSALMKNTAYFGVAARELEMDDALPEEAAAMVRKELSLIQGHGGFSTGAVFPYKVDYSQFVTRGHYTRTKELETYFRAAMWYGLAPFALEMMTEDGKKRTDDQILQGLLWVHSLYRADLAAKWDRVYGPISFYVGTSDDLTPAEWKQAMDEVYGADAGPEDFLAPDRLDTFVTAVKKLRPARIQARVHPAVAAGMPSPEAQLRFLGQRYIPDSEVLQRLSTPIDRVFPRGLDVMAVLGSERAAEILDASPDEYETGSWAAYVPERDKLVREFGELEPETWRSNIYWRWLNALQALLEPAPEGFPSFMRDAAWTDKSLNTSLASWAELRHDTILYGKQSVTAECGDDEEPPPPVRGYVEPNVRFYDRLLKATQRLRYELEVRKLREKGDDGDIHLRELADLLEFLKTVSEKELRNEALTDTEYEEIRYIGGHFEYMTLSVLDAAGMDWALVNETDRNMACIADVHTGLSVAQGNLVLEEGVGPASEIVVVVPVAGRLSLARGTVFSYYEFKHPQNDRLTDEKWQQMLKEGRAPAPPKWTQSFLLRGDPRHVPAEEYLPPGSGC